MERKNGETILRNRIFDIYCNHKETNNYRDRKKYLLGDSIWRRSFGTFMRRNLLRSARPYGLQRLFFPSELSTYSVCLQLHKSEVLKLPIVIWYFFQKENTNPQKRVIIKYSPIQKEKK
jgi:hypothetical protein